MKSKNKDFKRLADDTKKTEQQAKIYHTGLVINLAIILVIIALITIVLFINPDLFSNKKNNVVNNSTSEINESTENKIVYSQFDVVSKYDKYYVIGNEQGIWKEIAEASEGTKIIGTYANKLYLYNNEGMQYIDFDNEEKEIQNWLKYKSYVVSDSDETGILHIANAYILEDTIYFKYVLDIASTVPAGGILCIKTNSSSFDEATQLVSDVKANEWSFDTDNATIYYLKNSKELYKYNIQGKNEELLLADVKSFQIVNHNILYLKLNNAYREPDNSIVQTASYGLYLYNLNTKSESLIFESPVYNVTTGSLNYFAKYYDGCVYYKKDNEIIKYDNGTETSIYTHDSDSLNGFNIDEHGIFELMVENNEKKYLKDGQVISNKPDTYTVTMKDNTRKNF